MLLLDYDGTLCPIADSPEKAVLPKEVRQTLHELTGRPHIRIAIISGRSLNDIKKQVGLDRIIYAGNHGLELSANDTKFVYPSKKQISMIHEIAKELNPIVENIEGAFLENKKLTLSVHYRNAAKEDALVLKSRVLKTIRTYLEFEQIKFNQGKCVLEIRPNEWHKGALIEWLLAHPKKFGIKADALSIYLGDDETDESAFSEINQFGGISIFVGSSSKKTNAKFFLSSPKKVYLFLKELLNLYEHKNQQHN